MELILLLPVQGFRDFSRIFRSDGKNIFSAALHADFTDHFEARAFWNTADHFFGRIFILYACKKQCVMQRIDRSGASSSFGDPCFSFGLRADPDISDGQIQRYHDFDHICTADLDVYNSCNVSGIAAPREVAVVSSAKSDRCYTGDNTLHML